MSYGVVDSSRFQQAAFQNIHFVTSTVHAAADIVDSIEKDMLDIRSTIRNREQQRLDSDELIRLLQAENRALNAKLHLAEVELDRGTAGIAEEYEGRLEACNAEIERVVQQCTAALEDKDSCLQVIQQLQHSLAEHQQHLHSTQAALRESQSENARLTKVLQNIQQSRARPAVTTPPAPVGGGYTPEKVMEQLAAITGRLAMLESENSMLHSSMQLQSPKGLRSDASAAATVDMRSAMPMTQSVESLTPVRALDTQPLSRASSSSSHQPQVIRRFSHDEEQLPLPLHPHGQDEYDLGSPQDSISSRSRDSSRHRYAEGIQAYNIQASANRYGYGDEDDDEDNAMHRHGRQAQYGVHGYSHGYVDDGDNFDNLQLDDVLNGNFR